MGEKEVSLQEIQSGFEFVPGLFGIVLRGGYLYGAWSRTVIILIEFQFIVPELWKLAVLCTCRILLEGHKFDENFALQQVRCASLDERWVTGVETQKNVRGEVGGWGRVPFNEPYAPSLSTIYDGA